MAAKVKANDMVMVISGDHRGETGKVLRVDPTRGVVFVEGVNLVYRHLRPSRRNPQGGRIRKEAPLHVSNVLPVDPKSGKPGRIRFVVDRDAAGHVTSKKRVTRSGTVLSEVAGKQG
ncbi:MAG: 50S ribosomal protein L24 [Phycisphaerae bacterium]